MNFVSWKSPEMGLLKGVLKIGAAMSGEALDEFK